MKQKRKKTCEALRRKKEQVTEKRIKGKYNVDYSSVFPQLLIIEQKLYHQLMQCSTCKDGLVEANKKW